MNDAHIDFRVAFSDEYDYDQFFVWFLSPCVWKCECMNETMCAGFEHVSVSKKTTKFGAVYDIKSGEQLTTFLIHLLQNIQNARITARISVHDVLSCLPPIAKLSEHVHISTLHISGSCPLSSLPNVIRDTLSVDCLRLCINSWRQFVTGGSYVFEYFTTHGVVKCNEINVLLAPGGYDPGIIGLTSPEILRYGQMTCPADLNDNEIDICIAEGFPNMSHLFPQIALNKNRHKIHLTFQCFLIINKHTLDITKLPRDLQVEYNSCLSIYKYFNTS